MPQNRPCPNSSKGLIIPLVWWYWTHRHRQPSLKSRLGKAIKKFRRLSSVVIRRRTCYINSRC